MTRGSFWVVSSKKRLLAPTGDSRAPEAFWFTYTPVLQTLPHSFLAAGTTLPSGPFVRTNSLSRLREISRENYPRFAGPCGWEKYRAHLEMAQMQGEQGGGAPLMAEGKSEAEVKLILYHWTHSFSSQKVKAPAGGGRRGSGFSTGTAPSGPGPRWPTWQQASEARAPPKLPPGQGCALVGGKEHQPEMERRCPRRCHSWN